MDIYTLSNPQFRLRVTPTAAALLSFERLVDNTPLLRSYDPALNWHPGASACFPMLPLANRVRNNRFTFGNRDVILPNSPLDERFFLHGDGWIQCWQLHHLDAHSVTLALQMKYTCGFDYSAQLVYRLTTQGIAADLCLCHRGSEPMLYGAGFHPFFSLWHDTVVQFTASGYWPEGDDHLPLAWCGELPEPVDFQQRKHPPCDWLNIGYSAWAGEAILQTPSRNLRLRLRSRTPYLMLYQDGKGAFICLEPQTHPVNAHRMPGNPGLVALGKGDSLYLSMQILVEGMA